MTAAIKLHISSEGDVNSEIRSRILKIVSKKKVCHLDDLVETCKDYSWNQLFLEVDRLSRNGSLRLLYQKDGDYEISLPLAA
jgi:hypothetical protein